MLAADRGGRAGFRSDVLTGSESGRAGLFITEYAEIVIAL